MVDARPPAPPAAVTTEVNGMIALPSDRSMARAPCRGRLEAVAVGDSDVGASVGWYQVWRRPSGSRKRVADLLGERRPPTRSASMPRTR